GGEAVGLLQHLAGDRLGGIDQLGERGDAGVGGLKNLDAVADRVEQVGDVAGAGVEAGAVKKLVGLSSAVLTFLPVARRVCVVASRSAVPCKESRFWRTAAERVMLERAMG